MSERLEDQVALRLRAVMMEFKISNYAELAALSGSSLSSVSNWLNGYNLPRVPEMLKLSSNLGLSLDWIYRGQIVGMDAKVLARLAIKVQALTT